MYNAYSVDGGRDTDGNGKPEIFVMGNLFADSTVSYTTMVYESSGDNTFVRVATISVDQGVGGGSNDNAVGNLDAAGREEYLMATTGPIRVFRATGPGRWVLVGTVFGYGGGVHTFDLNLNGRPEVIWRTVAPRATQILEYPGPDSSANLGASPTHASITVVPNPCRGQATLQLAQSLQDAARLSVFDVNGRLVDRRSIANPRAQLLWPARGLRGGVYIVRIEDTSGRAIALGRGTIIR